MDLKAWRKAHSRTLADVARVLGIAGKNPSRTVQRYETGAARIDLATAAAITVMTGGAVTFEDLCRARREFIAAGGIEKGGRRISVHLDGRSADARPPILDKRPGGA